MNNTRVKNKYLLEAHKGESGSAIVIALFVLALIGVFAALAMTRTGTEAAAVANESADGRTLYAAQGSLEMMTRNFNKVFETKLNPSDIDLDKVRTGSVPILSADYQFDQSLPLRIQDPVAKVLDGGAYTGLYAIRDIWQLKTIATDKNTGSQVELTRNILNNRIPIFQFGIFYDDDLELFRPPRFSFGGRVHSNGNFFISPGADGVYFNSRVTAVKEVVTQTWRNGYTGDSGNNQTFIKNASGVDKQLLPGEGSVLNGSPNIFSSNPDMPSSRTNPSWTSQSAKFDGNLQAHVDSLNLPLRVGDAGGAISLIQMIKRGKKLATGVEGGDLAGNNTTTAVAVTNDTNPRTGVDNEIMRAERFSNKTGIRISLSDSKAKLPGCATSTGGTVAVACGIRLDGNKAGDGNEPLTLLLATVALDTSLASRGYSPKQMRDGYQATRINGSRLNTGGTRQVWIKVETVATDQVTGAIVTEDITEDVLSLGMTEQAPSLPDFAMTGYNATAPNSSLIANVPQTASTGTDSRSIIKIQRFVIPGPPILASSNYLTSFTSGSYQYNVVARYTGSSIVTAPTGCLLGCIAKNTDPNGSLENYGHLKHATISGTTGYALVPFPIEMYDAREGNYYDDKTATYYPAASFGGILTSTQKVARNGIMSMLDIDIANLRRFLRGDFNDAFRGDTPFALKKGDNLRASWRPGVPNDIPLNDGWVLYVSDRRGDEDFDGEFDMEDVFGGVPGNDGVLRNGEDVNFDGVLNMRVGFNGGNEAERYRDQTITPDQGAINDHKYYRRGVRLINGTVVPGVYDVDKPTNTRGFTVASENGVYVKGNYNATGTNALPAAGNSPYTDYLPLNTSTHIPAAIVADGVTILSNSKYDLNSSLASYADGWNDAKSFASPYDQSARVANSTTIRFAMISGDTISNLDNGDPGQGGTLGSSRLNGGVHNFKRFLETWAGKNLNYAGSLINLYNSRNANGSFKCCGTVYNPPIRNWVFDSTFLDPARLPPGTPFFQYVQTTGFERKNS